MSTINAEERAALQRTFMLRVSPQIGHDIAEQLGGFVTPGIDSMHHDLKDTLELWFKMYAAGGTALVKETAWWMTRLHDRYGRLSRDETTQRADELSCYAIATIGTLIDQGVLQFAKEVEIPKIMIPGEDPGNDPITQALLERLEATLKEDEDE